MDTEMEISQSYIGTPCGLVVCVDRAGSRRLWGRYYHRYSREGKEFGSLEELVFGMERFFDKLNFPRVSQKRRAFPGTVPVPGRRDAEECKRDERRMAMEEEELLRQHGDLGTFIVRVQHRQNSSWQGRITWADKNKTVNFRSIWEMVQLIGDALDTMGGQDEGVEAMRWPEEEA